VSRIPETPHDGGLRDVLVLAPRENKLEKEPIIARAAHSQVVAHIAVPARESAPAVGSAIRPDRAAQSTVFQHQNPLSLRRSIQPDEELRDAGPSQIRRWLKPGLRLTLIIGAAAVVPAALAMGVYMARHQKTVVVVPSPVGPKGSFLVERAITPAPPVAASPTVDVARSPKEVIVSQTGSGRSIPPAAPVRLAPHATVAFSALAKPTPKLSPRSASVEPPPIVGTQTKDPDIGKAFLGNSVPSPTPPAVIIASNPPPSLGAPTKERGPGTGLPGSTSLVANIPSHLEPPRLVSSPPPNYPTVARSSPVGGYVLIDAVVDETGKVADMKVISGNSVLTSAATEALRKWKYEPARLNGQPTSAHVRVRMDFSPH
jgi:protein TonB